MEDIIQCMIDKKIWAVVGATQNPTKFGYKIFKRLKSAGYEVYPVNPVYESIEGEKCYGSLSQLPVQVDCVNIVVSPEKALVVVQEAIDNGLNYLWFQPGSFDDGVIAMAEKNNCQVVYHHCILVELNNRGK